jgi:hypothetical protein
MFMVGRGRFPHPLVVDLADRTAEYPELGPIGDLLTSSSVPITASVLVIQQHDVIHKDEVPFTKNGESTSLSVSLSPSTDLSSCHSTTA